MTTKTRRPGAGRKKGSGKFGEPTTVVRIPISQATKLEDLLEIPAELYQLIETWRNRYSGDVRSDVAKRCATDIADILHSHSLPRIME